MVRAAGEDCRLAVRRVCDDGQPASGIFRSDWMLLRNDADLLRAIPPEKSGDANRVLRWTDQFSNLFQILKSE